MKGEWIKAEDCSRLAVFLHLSYAGEDGEAYAGIYTVMSYKDDYCPFPLMPGEQVVFTARPHLLAMAGLTLFWIGIAALGVIFIAYYEEITDYVQGIIRFEFLKFIADRAYDIVWFGALLVPLVVMAVFRINFRYVLALILLIAGSVLLQWKVEPMLDVKGHAHLENIMLIGVGMLGVLGVEIFRRGHRYYVTNFRIVARFGTLTVSERSTLYSKIDDLILQQGVLGRLFNFGTVIPITSTGLGMGHDFAIAGAGAGGGKAGVAAGLFAAGGKAQNVPRELSIYVLYKIKDPEWARDVVLEQMRAREAGAPVSYEDSDTEYSGETDYTEDSLEGSEY